MYIEICTARGTAYLIHFGSYPKLESWINEVINAKYIIVNEGEILIEKLFNLNFLILPSLENLLYIRVICGKKNNDHEIRVFPSPRRSIQSQEHELNIERIKQNIDIAIYHINVI